GTAEVGTTGGAERFGPAPRAFTAYTENVYVVPLVSPSTSTARRSAPTSIALGPPSTTYLRIGEPLSRAGPHATLTRASPAHATTLVGALGGPGWACAGG